MYIGGVERDMQVQSSTFKGGAGGNQALPTPPKPSSHHTVNTGNKGSEEHCRKYTVCAWGQEKGDVDTAHH